MISNPCSAILEYLYLGAWWLSGGVWCRRSLVRIPL